MGRQAGVQRWALDAGASCTDAQQRLAHWQAVVAEAFGPCRLVPDGLQAAGVRLRGTRRQGLQVSDLAYRGLVVERTPADVARIDREFYTLGCPVAGPLVARTGGRELLIAPGALYLVNQCLPYRASTPAGYRNRSITLPAEALRQREPRLGPVHRLALDDGTPRAELLMHYLQHLASGIGGWSDAELSALTQSLLDLVVLLLVRQDRAWASGAEPGVRLAHRERALAHIRLHLGDPDLQPADIAAACGVSLSYLHQVFRASGTSVGQALAAERMAAACRLLADPACAALPVGRVGARVGLRHAAQFSRLFKAHTGQAPRDYRVLRLAPVPGIRASE